MGDTVFVNGRAVVHKGSSGKSMAAFPDVCLCPPTPPAGPIPTPLPNNAMASDLQSGADSVQIEGSPMAKKSSFIGKSTGNEAAQSTGGGVVTAVVQGKAYFESYSMDVLVEGEEVPRHMDMLTHNHASPPGNTPPWAWLSLLAVAMKPGKLPDVSSVKLVRLWFNSDHGLLSDYESDWKRGGKKYKEQGDKSEWASDHNFPITHTKNMAVKITAELEVKPPASAPVSVKLESDGSLVFKAGGVFMGKGNLIVSGRSTKLLPDKVVKIEETFNWTAKARGKSLSAGKTGKHTIYVTLGIPDGVLDIVNEDPSLEGVTKKRMEKAVELVGAVGSNDPHTIVNTLMRKFPYYTLEKSLKVPIQFRHPTYFNKQGGPWPMADYIKRTGECQAIVRFVRAVIKQVGIPGNADAVVVWADPDVEGGSKALEAMLGSGGGLGHKTLVFAHATWHAVLLDGDPIEEGHVFPEGGIGVNNFEACLRFTHNKKTKYYGGGAGVYDSKDEVITAFYALCWISYSTSSMGNTVTTIERIVQRYR